MRIVAARVREIAWTLDGHGAAAGRTDRCGLVLEVETDDGTTGFGEASPLPGMSLDSLADARIALARFVDRVPLVVDSARAIFASARDVAIAPTTLAESGLAERSSNAARFAIETALLAALVNTHRSTMTEVLEAVRNHSPREPTGSTISEVGTTRVSQLPTSAVVESATEATTAIAAGARALKLKAHEGLDPAMRTLEIIELVREVAGVAGKVPLRLDANRTWSRARVRDRLAAIATLDVTIEFVEEPCVDAHELLAEPPLPLLIALDESLAGLDDEALDRALGATSLGALILKPTLLGGFAACLALAARARKAGVAAIVTHALESPIGAAACSELARVVGGPRAHGVRATADSTRDLGSTRASPHVTATRDGSTHEHTCRMATIRVASPDELTISMLRDALDRRAPIALLHPALPAAELERQRAAVESAALRDDDAIILFTSGSTGTARGVVLSRSAIDAAVAASEAHLGWRETDRWLLALSTAHAGGAAVVARCHAAGKPIHLLAHWERAAAVAALEHVTLASLVPTQLADLLADPAWRPPAGLRAVLLGGAASSPSLLAEAARRGVPFLTTYGMTESFGQLATAPLDRAGDPDAPLVPLRGVGFAAGTREAPAPIRVRAPMLAARYLDGTPIAPEHVTSDLGFCEASLHIVGRADDMIITGGENVSPATVEAVLAATPGVRAAIVFGIPDATWGQIVGAAIAAESVDASAVAAWHAALPAHARPRELAIVSTLPQLATGKLDRRAAARLPRERIRY